MLVVFDVDGTLIDGEQADWACFGSAYQQVTGRTLTREFWREIEEVTAQAIIHQALFDRPRIEREEIERLVRSTYLERLSEAVKENRKTFSATKGAEELLGELRGAQQIDVAIATGDWLPSVSFKLESAGVSVNGFPIATSSDCYSRSDIVSLAVNRADRSIEDAVYVGDGLWDLRACRALGIPLIATGSRIDQLREAGARYLMPDLEKGRFLKLISQIGCADSARCIGRGD